MGVQLNDKGTTMGKSIYSTPESFFVSMQDRKLITWRGAINGLILLTSIPVLLLFVATLVFTALGVQHAYDMIEPMIFWFMRNILYWSYINLIAFVFTTYLLIRRMRKERPSSQEQLAFFSTIIASLVLNVFSGLR